jgi:hypothetical protein
MPKREYGTPQDTLVLERLVDFKHELQIDKDVEIRVRQSTEDQVGNNSTEIQLEDIKKAIIEAGWKENQIYVNDIDNGQSGRIKLLTDLPGLTRIANRVESGEIGTIFASNVSRFFRAEWQRPSADLADLCRANNVQIVVFEPSLEIFNFSRDDDIDRFMRATSLSAKENRLRIAATVNGRRKQAQKGLWFGQSMSAGYMVDTRKKIGSITNEMYHVLVPVKEIQAVIIVYFELALQYSGDIRAIVTHIEKYGPLYPNFDDLEKKYPGYKLVLPHNLKLNRPSVSSLRSIYTDVRLIGRTVYKNSVVEVAPRYEALVPEGLFYSVFRMFSSTMPDGSPNPEYKPRTVHKRSSLDQTRKEQRPTYEGLVVMLVGSKYKPVKSRFISNANRWNYKSLKPNDWTRRADLLDSVIDDALDHRLRSIFDATWVLDRLESKKLRKEQMIDDLRSQIQRTEDEQFDWNDIKIKSSRQRVIDKAEIKIDELEGNLDDLQDELTKAHNLVSSFDDSTQILRDQPEKLLCYWKNASKKVRRIVADVLTKRIEVYREMPSGELTLKIVWRGGEVTEHVIAKGRGGWTRRDEEILCKMVNHGRSQIEIAREFPTRKWSSIRDKASRLGIGSMLNMSIKPILDDKTYNDYLARQHKPYKAQSGMAWSEEEIALLAKLVDADEPAFEIYKAIPYRTRDAIRKKVTSKYGQEKVLRGKHFLKRYETYNQYVARMSKTAAVA